MTELHTDTERCSPGREQQPAVGFGSSAIEREIGSLADLIHDIRQPLSTIECLTYYLELTCRDASSQTHLRRIQDMIVQINHILEHRVDLNQTTASPLLQAAV